MEEVIVFSSSVYFCLRSSCFSLDFFNVFIFSICLSNCVFSVLISFLSFIICSHFCSTFSSVTSFSNKPGSAFWIVLLNDSYFVDVFIKVFCACSVFFLASFNLSLVTSVSFALALCGCDSLPQTGQGEPSCK